MQLADDTDGNVRNGSELLDRLMKDIVTESALFNIPAFIPLLRERIYTKKPFCRRFITSWVRVYVCMSVCMCFIGSADYKEIMCIARRHEHGKSVSELLFEQLQWLLFSWLSWFLNFPFTYFCFDYTLCSLAKLYIDSTHIVHCVVDTATTICTTKPLMAALLVPRLTHIV